MGANVRNIAMNFTVPALSAKSVSCLIEPCVNRAFHWIGLTLFIPKGNKLQDGCRSTVTSRSTTAFQTFIFYFKPATSSKYPTNTGNRSASTGR